MLLEPSSKNNRLSFAAIHIAIHIVTPAPAGVQNIEKTLDSGYCRNDVWQNISKMRMQRLLLDIP